MEYVITTDQPFEEIEAVTVEALERQGWVVQRTFSLSSAVGAGGRDSGSSKGTAGNPGYSVLMLYGLGVRRRPLGLITLYQRGGQTVIRALPTPVENRRPLSVDAHDSITDQDADANAELVAALVLSGMEFCVDVADGQNCIDTREAGEGIAGSGRLIQDPVRGKWIDRGQAEAGLESEGRV